MKGRIAAAALLLATQVFVNAQGRGAAPAPPPPGKSGAPFDLTGYWVSLIVDEWRFRVTPQKGDIPYLPLNAEARRIANEWDPAKDEAEGKACKAYGAVGVIQRPGRLHITWDDDNTMRMEADAGTQTRVIHFNLPPEKKGEASWQGYSVAQWQIPRNAVIDLGGVGYAPDGGKTPMKTGTLKITTMNMLPGYLRKNGVPYSANAVLTEYINRIIGADGQIYIALTAMLDDPTYLTGPFIRTYQFKKQADSKGWEPTACLPR